MTDSCHILLASAFVIILRFSYGSWQTSGKQECLVLLMWVTKVVVYLKCVNKPRCGHIVLHCLLECKMRKMLSRGTGMWAEDLAHQHILVLSRPWRIRYEIHAYLISLVKWCNPIVRHTTRCYRSYKYAYSIHPTSLSLALLEGINETGGLCRQWRS